VSCPDWNALAFWRQDPEGQEPAAWQEALVHLDACGLCRAAALAADPTLVFHRLPVLGPDALDAAAEADEVAAMQQAVAAMRTASRLEREPRRAAPHWKRWVAAAAVTLTGGLGTWYELPARPNADAEDLSALPFHSSAPSVVPPSQLIEDFDRPSARVQEFGGKDRWDLKVAMVYDPSFDVPSGS
jgi:hypothetical protein